MYDIDRAIRRLELAQRIDELQRQKAATAEQGLSVDAIATSEDTVGAEAIPPPDVPAPTPAAAAITPVQSPTPARASVGPQPAPKFELAAPSVASPSTPASAVVAPPVTTPAAAAPAVVVTQEAPSVASVVPTPDNGIGMPLPVRDKAARAEAALRAAATAATTPVAATSLDGAVSEQDEIAGEALIGAALLAEKVPQESVNGKRWAEALEEHLARTTPAENGPVTPVAGVQGPPDDAPEQEHPREPVHESAVESVLESGPEPEREVIETSRSPLPRAVAPMPLASWATPPGGPDSEPGQPVAPLSRGASERPRPSTSDLLPRAVVPVTNASRAQPARHAVDGHGPGSHKAWVEGLGAEQLQRNAFSVPATASATEPAEGPADGAPKHPAAQEPPVAQAEAPLEPVESIDGEETRTTEGEETGEPAEPTTDGSGLTAATIIADLLRHGNRSLLR